MHDKLMLLYGRVIDELLSFVCVRGGSECIV